MNWRYLVAAVFVIGSFAVIINQQMTITELEREKADAAQAVADNAVHSINALIPLVNEAGNQKKESKIITKEVVKYVREQSKTDKCYDAPVNDDAYQRMHERSNQVRKSASG